MVEGRLGFEGSQRFLKVDGSVLRGSVPVIKSVVSNIHHSRLLRTTQCNFYEGLFCVCELR
jgi:hypothetical protein